MYKSLIRSPLQQTMALVWLFGLYRLLTWPFEAPPTWSWSLSAGLGAAVVLLIGARWRQLAVIPVAVLLSQALIGAKKW